MSKHMPGSVEQFWSVIQPLPRTIRRKPNPFGDCFGYRNFAFVSLEPLTEAQELCSLDDVAVLRAWLNANDGTPSTVTATIHPASSDLMVLVGTPAASCARSNPIAECEPVYLGASLTPLRSCQGSPLLLMVQTGAGSEGPAHPSAERRRWLDLACLPSRGRWRMQARRLTGIAQPLRPSPEAH